MFPLGDDRWGILAGVALLGILAIYTPVIYRQIRRRRSKIAQPGVSLEVDYMKACVIANRYIDPDETMASSKLIAVRAQILARFDKVVGARIGDQYNGQLLHHWFQKNAARSLVAHQDEIT